MSNREAVTLNPEATSFVPSSTVESPARLDSPTLRGHPHRKASPQLTTPFWQQQPEITHGQTYYYPPLDLYTAFPLYQLPTGEMDSTPVVIGYGSKFGRPSENRDGSGRADRVRCPRQILKIYLLGGAEIGEMSLGVLTRFSKLAKTTFPRPEATIQSKGTTPIGNEQAKGMADRGVSGKTWADVVEQDKRQSLKNATPPTTSKTSSLGSAISAPAQPTSDASEVKHLTVAVKDAWEQPSTNVIRYMLNWMDECKSIRNDDPLLPIAPAAYSKLSLKVLVEIYTGVLAFDLQPFPHELRHEILTRLSDQPIKRDDVEMFYTRLPPSDPVINRMITSFFEHNEKGRYTEDEIKAIQDYANLEVDDDGQLARHYRRVEGRRSHNKKREAGITKLRDGFAAFAGDMTEALPEPAQYSVNDQSKQPRGRRDRRRQQRDGKAKGDGAEAATKKA